MGEGGYKYSGKDYKYYKYAIFRGLYVTGGNNPKIGQRLTIIMRRCYCVGTKTLGVAQEAGIRILRAA